MPAILETELFIKAASTKVLTWLRTGIYPLSIYAKTINTVWVPTMREISSVRDFYKMGGRSHGIPGKQVDGMNVLEVYEEMLQAVRIARESGLSSFLEIKTYRYRGHSMSDPAKYRTREELDEYRQQDPILLSKDALIEYGIISGR